MALIERIGLPYTVYQFSSLVSSSFKARSLSNIYRNTQKGD